MSAWWTLGLRCNRCDARADQTVPDVDPGLYSYALVKLRKLARESEGWSSRKEGRHVRDYCAPCTTENEEQEQEQERRSQQAGSGGA